MTPADELRQAATRLRELAADATPGPWSVTVDDDVVADTVDSGYGPQSVAPNVITPEDMKWIAAMSPVIAEPMADLLDHASDWYSEPRQFSLAAEWIERLCIDIARTINRAAP